VWEFYYRAAIYEEPGSTSGGLRRLLTARRRDREQEEGLLADGDKKGSRG
jgi:hypothetical protein